MTTMILMVTGAPGAGKTTAARTLLRRPRPYPVLDMDWLLSPASHLARADIRTAPATWPAYNAVWGAFLHSLTLNALTPIFFAPLAPQDIAWGADPPLAWLVLDCADGIRQKRLADRPGWTAAMIEEALADAQALREQITDRLDTGDRDSEDVAAAILHWAHRQCPAGPA